MKGIFLNEGLGGTNYYRDEISRRTTGASVMTRNINPNLHDICKELIKGTFSKGYSLSSTSRENIVRILCLLGTRVPDYTKTNISCAYLIVDVNFTYTLPVLIFIDTDSREMFGMYTVLQSSDNSIVVKAVGVNLSIEEKKLGKLLAEVSTAIDKTFA